MLRQNSATISETDKSGRTPHGWRQAEIIAAVAAIVCFANVLPNDFCFDDYPIVRNNPKVNEAGGWRDIWTTDYWSTSSEGWPGRDLLYRPVSLSSYKLVRVIFGPHPFPHHLVNLVLHALVSVLIVRLCRYLGGSEGAALLAGVLFAVLPIHTEAVVPVVGRADLLMTFGVLAAVLAHRRSLCVHTQNCATEKHDPVNGSVSGLREAARAEARGSGSVETARAEARGSGLSDTLSSAHILWWRAVAALAAFVGMGSKEAGISVVALVALFDTFWLRRFRERPGRGRNWWTWRTLFRLTYVAIPLLVYLALRYYALGGRLYQRPPLTKTVNILVDAPPWQHLLGVLQLWGMYWTKTVWPAVLSIKYSINGLHLATTPLDAHVLIGMVVTIVLLVGSLLAWRRGTRTVAFVSAAMVLSYLPTANAFVLIQVFFAERIWYLPSVWVALLIALTAARYVLRPAWWAVVVVLVLGMTARCWVRNAEWKDNGTLYAAAYRDQSDSAGALQLYGQWLVDNGEYERGVQLLERAIEIDQGFTDAHRSLGSAHLRAGNLEKALRHLQIARMQVPGHPATDAALKRVSDLLSESDEELHRLREQVEQGPADVEEEIALVRRLRELSRVEQALERLRRRESDFAGSSEWQAEYAVTLVYANRIDRAIERYRQSLRLDPDHPQRAVELAMLLLERREGKDIDEAWRWVEHASRLVPDAPSVLACRAELLALRGDLAGAVELFDRAIQALPEGSGQRRIFEERARTLGR